MSGGDITLTAGTHILGLHADTQYFNVNSLSLTLEEAKPTITATAGPGGAISPSGVMSVNIGASPTFVITPNKEVTAYFYSLAVLLLPALGTHVYFETSALIITLIKLGKLLEIRAKGQTGSAIKKLLDLRPKTARLVRENRETDVPVEDVGVGADQGHQVGVDHLSHDQEPCLLTRFSQNP